MALEGKAAIVTGASKAIGRAIAVGLGRSGASVAVNYCNDREGAEEVALEISRAGGTSVVIGADVSRPDEARRLVETVHDEFGRLDVLVNNAARMRFGEVSEVTEADWEDVLGTNVRGAFFAAVHAARLMGDAGSIINVSSCAATLMVPDHAVYAPSKGALEALTRQLAHDLAPRVRVNAIAPGPTSTDRNHDYDPDYDRRWAARIPLGRVAMPEDYIGPAVFLASDASAFVTGTLLHVDGGWTVKGDYPTMTDADFDRTVRAGQVEGA
jgi:3-oxoacyl-[acyl-carrier protein] reductase